jgi:hypothetical protein
VPIAVTESRRSPLWPEVPTVAETYPGYELHGFVALVAPRGTPIEIVLKVNQAMRNALADPAFKDQLLSMGLTPQPGSEDYLAFLQRNRTLEVRQSCQDKATVVSCCRRLPMMSSIRGLCRRPPNICIDRSAQQLRCCSRASAGARSCRSFYVLVLHAG